MRISALNWTHLVACLLVGVTAVLLSFGALVTTYEAAMAVPDWPATYGHNMFLFPWPSGFMARGICFSSTAIGCSEQ